MTRYALRLALLTCLISPLANRAADPPKVDPYDQSDVALEKEPADPKLAKIVLIAGSRSHGPGEHEFFAGTAILMKLLQETPGVFPVMARDGWPKNEKIFDNARAVVFYLDGRGGHPLADPRKLGLIQKLIDQKCGFVCLHYAVDYNPREGERVIDWMGGYYDARISINPHWDADFKSMPKHPITRDVKPFAIRDEWYFNMRFPARHERRHADPAGDPAGWRARHSRRQETSRPIRNRRLGHGPPRRRPRLRLHRRPLP